MSRAQIITGDVLEWAESYSGPPFHALLCDPPYHLTSITKRFGKPGSAPAKEGVYNRGVKGFMGKEWDGGDIAFRPETWAALAEHLYPGAFIMAFCGSRGWHRQAVAMEDAGLIFHPTIFLLWCYGSGFPKATRVKDKRFDGHRYGAQAMKPAAEPILVCQKPYQGKPVECITKTGSGALNIDAGRIGTNGETPCGSGPPASTLDRAAINPGRSGGNGGNVTTLGRWPANLCMDEVGAAALDAQSGVSAGTYSPPKARARNNGIGLGSAGQRSGASLAPDNFGDTGGASRFFHVSDWTPELAESDPFLYCAKAGSAERNAGLESRAYGYRENGFSASISDTKNPRGNGHPTVKPIRLTRWLASLLLPPAEYAPRRI